MPQTDETVECIVLVSKSYQSDWEEVCHRLQSAGMQVDQILDHIGVLTGRVACDRLRQIEQVEGVSAVETAHEYSALPFPPSP